MIRSVTGLHIYYYFGHLCDYQLHRTVNDKRPPITSPSVLLLLEQGRRNEDLYVEHLRTLTEVVSFKDPNLSMEERAVQTLAAMRAGTPIIHNGVLDGAGASAALAAHYADLGLALRFRGETDLLVRVDGLPSAFGDYSYRVADVKSSRTSKFPQMMQVAYYDWMLKAVQGSSCGKGEIIVFPNGPLAEPAEELFDLALLEPSLTLFLEERLGDVLTRPQAEVPYHLTRDCRRCLWHTHCQERAEAERDLSLVFGVRPSQKRALQTAGIATVEALAKADDIALAPLSQAAGDGFLRARSQARALTANQFAERVPLDVVLADWIAENERDLAGLRTENRLPVYLSVDADALTATTFSYGVAVGEHPAQVFGAEQAKEEDLAFFRFCEGMEKVKARARGRYAVYHFGASTVFRLQRLVEKYPSANLVPVVEDVLKHMVDLRAILQRAFFFPASLDAVKDAVQLLSVSPVNTRSVISKPNGSLEALAAILQAAGDEPPVADECLGEIKAAALRIGVAPETLIADDDDLSVVWFRMFLERKHAVWQKLIDRKQSERLQELRAVADWVLHYAPESEPREKEGAIV